MRSLARLGQSVSASDPPHDWGCSLFDLDPARLPDLPPIPNRALAELARTHKSSVTDLKTGTRSDNYLAELQSNGRLEWQGDAVLRYLISKKLLRMLEFATAGFLSEIRNRLVSNRTFSHIAWHYGLQDTLKTNPDLKNRAPAMEQKTLANTFEAYLGAVVSASGEDVLADYVDKLLQPEVFPQLGALQKKLNQPLSRWEGEDRHKKRRLDMLVPEMDDLLGDAQGRHSRTNSIAHSWEDVWTQPTGWISTLVGPEGTAVGQAPNKMKSRDEAVGAYLRREFKTCEFKVGDCEAGEAGEACEA